MPGVLDTAALVAPATLAAWRAWLVANHATSPGVWLVWHKQSTGRSQFPRGEAVKEALCFGWIDSLPRAVDSDRTSCYFSRRKPGGVWSAINKRSVDELVRDGRMAPAGLAAVELAKRNGAWVALDASDALIVPPDLAAALAATDASRSWWDAFPPSARKSLLQWIASAKRAETRAARVRETAAKAAVGERANAYVRPGAAPKRHAAGAADAAAAAIAGATAPPAAKKRR